MQVSSVDLLLHAGFTWEYNIACGFYGVQAIIYARFLNMQWTTIIHIA